MIFCRTSRSLGSKYRKNGYDRCLILLRFWPPKNDTKNSNLTVITFLSDIFMKVWQIFLIGCLQWHFWDLFGSAGSCDPKTGNSSIHCMWCIPDSLNHILKKDLQYLEGSWSAPFLLLMLQQILQNIFLSKLLKS